MISRADKKIFATLFFSVFSAVMGVGIVVPLIPIYAQSLGASGLYIGLVFASFSLSRSFLLPLFGKLSDRTGRKPYIFVGLFGYTLVSAGFIFSDSVSSLILIRFFQGISSAMVVPVVQAYVGDITPVNREGMMMGMFNMSMFTSLSIGPLAGGLISDALGMKAAFLSMGVLSLIGALMSLLFLPPLREEPIARRKGETPAAWGVLLRDVSLYGIFTLRLSYVFCIGVIWCFLPLLSRDFGLSTAAIGFLIMLGVFMSGLLQIPMGRVADRVDKRKMAVLGGVIVAVDIVTYQWAHGFWGLFAASVVFGLGGGIVMPPLMAMAVIKGGQNRAMGSVMSLLTLAHSLGMLLGALSAGILMDLFDIGRGFQLAGVFMLAGTVVFAVCLAPRKTAAPSLDES
ncbi:MAG: MFS transporter [Desulfosudaceae bacterium]